MKTESLFRQPAVSQSLKALIIFTSAILIAGFLFIYGIEGTAADESIRADHNATPMQPPSVKYGETLDAQMLTQLQKAHPAVRYIDWKAEAPINAQYSLVGVYGVPRNPMMDYGYMLDAQQIGIFIVDNKSHQLVITLDVLATQRGGDFYPHFEAATTNEAVVNFESDYGELARKKYFYDLQSMRRLKIVSLPVRPRSEYCTDENGNRVECID